MYRHIHVSCEEMQMAGDDVNGGSRSSPAGCARCDGRGYRLSRAGPEPRVLVTGLFSGLTPKNDPPCRSSGWPSSTCSAVSPDASIRSMANFAACAAVSFCAIAFPPDLSVDVPCNIDKRVHSVVGQRFDLFTQGVYSFVVYITIL